MAEFTQLTARAVPLPENHIDTDQIIPARFLKVTDKQGLGEKLFFDWRYLEDGAPNPRFVLNAPERQGAQVLVGGENFGSGSSREHAPWALLGWGFRAVVALSFADIFRGNALKNGLLPVQLAADEHARLLAAVSADANAELTIDLERCRVTLPDGTEASFDVDAFARKCLLSGVDQLGYLLGFEERIREYEQRHA